MFEDFPADKYKNLIMRQGAAGLSEYAMYFREAADRLADSFTGQPFDDTILMPWLFLHRHATELLLKTAITEATRLRRAEDQDPSLAPDAVKKQLKSKLGHKLVPLVDELDTHLEALELEKTPKQTRRTLARLAQLDPNGESFRYNGGLPAGDDRVDFPSLRQALSDMLDTLSGALDVLDNYADYQQDMMSYMDAGDYMDL